MATRENPAVREFILAHVRDEPLRISTITAARFGLSRTAVAGYLRRLVQAGFLDANGNTRARVHVRRPLAEVVFEVRLQRDGTAEDHIWRFRLLPAMTDAPQNIVDICQYGFTEILNNAVDHSGITTASVHLTRYHDETEIWVIDKGIGIFEKIKQDFNLEDRRHALLELTKGGLTSDPRRHAGEGIFYTSRMFSRFFIGSTDLALMTRQDAERGFVLEAPEGSQPPGTAVRMQIDHSAKWTTRQVFQRYQAPGQASFRKTEIIVALGLYPGEQLVSRSQAKRLLARVDRFSGVICDFTGIDHIGQAFADEIFRVFAHAHPAVPLSFINANDEIRRMIQHVRRSDDAATPRLPGL